MRPEDLGIAGYTPSPIPSPPTTPAMVRTQKSPETALMQTAHDVGLRVRDLAAVAEMIGAEHDAMRINLDRSQRMVRQLGIENVFLRRALEEAHRHRSFLFFAGIAVVVIVLSR